MTEEDVQLPFRRSSIYRQLSDVLKSKRKSYCHGSPPVTTTNSTFTFVWNCALTEVNSPTKEDVHRTPPTLVKQKSISCDDVAFLSTNTNEPIIENKSKENGLV
jgi:hypothetical protein